MRIGTWNLDRSAVRGKLRWSGQPELIVSANADVWMLTEASRSQALPGMRGVFSAPGQGIYSEHECAASVWAAAETRQLEVANSRLSACAEVVHEGWPPLIVYATIIPYAADGVASGEARRWERHKASVADVISDCERLRRDFPTHQLIVGGDFNMNLDGTRWYGLDETRASLVAGMAKVDMKCRASDDLRARGAKRANVDHIWASTGLKQAAEMDFWHTDLSDHNASLVDFELGFRPPSS